MCMILRNSDTDKHIAETDIVVYKVAKKISDNKYESVFRRYVYEKNKVNNGSINTRTAIAEGQPNTRTVEEGFHSYKCLEDAKFDYCIRTTCGSRNLVIVKCIIPKKSTFYNGFQKIGINVPVKAIRETSQYVSNKIIVKKEV